MSIDEMYLSEEKQEWFLVFQEYKWNCLCFLQNQLYNTYNTKQCIHY